MPHPGTHDWQRTTRLGRRGDLEPEIELRLTLLEPLPGNGLERLDLFGGVSRPDVLDRARPTSEECTIWTAVAPDAVLTVRTYSTRAPSRDLDECAKPSTPPHIAAAQRYTPLLNPGKWPSQVCPAFRRPNTRRQISA